MVNALGTLFGDIANAIRGKTGGAATMKPLDFPGAIENIESANAPNEINELIDVINGEIINGVVVTFIGADGSVLCEVTVAPGYDCPNPVTAGLIEKPTKEPSQTEVYKHSGWSLTQDGQRDHTALLNVTEDRTVYAAFEASTRYYTIRFFDGNTLIHTEQLAFGSSSEFVHEKLGYYFQGWTPAPSNIESDLDCYGEWIHAAFAVDSWETIKANVRSGNAKDYYAVGEERVLDINIDGVNNTVILRVVGIGIDTVVDEDGNETTNSMTVIAKTPLKQPILAYSTQEENFAGFVTSNIKTYLDTKVWNKLSGSLTDAIRSTKKKYNYITGINTYTKTDFFKLWIPSIGEVGGSEFYASVANNNYSISDFSYRPYVKELNETNGTGITTGNGVWPKRIKTQYDSDDPVAWWLRETARTTAVAVKPDGSIETGMQLDMHDAHIVFGFCI